MFRVTTLELYHNFSFAVQLYSIFMLLSDAALSAHEWYFRTVSTIRGNLRQIKLLVFLLGRGERVIVKCWVFFGFFFFYFFFPSCLLKLKLPQLHKGRLLLGQTYFRIKAFILKCFSLLAKGFSGHFGAVIRKPDTFKGCL